MARSTSQSAAQHAASWGRRITRAWRILPHERRLAAGAALGLFVALFLPWYHETVVAVTMKPQAVGTSVTGWGAFSFVEAAVLLVAAGVLTLLFQRAEGRAFHLPGGDGWVITVAGFWTCVLVIWRIFDKQSVNVRGPGTNISGVEWGIFVALGVAALLAYAGSRVRAAHRPEPPLPGQDPAPQPPSPGQDPAPQPPSARQDPAPQPPSPGQDPAPQPPSPGQDPAPQPPSPSSTVTAPTRVRRHPSAEEQLTIPFEPEQR